MAITAPIRRLWTPSYKSGFARSAAESANPGLWDGLVGAWVPALGPTGGTLHDIVSGTPGAITGDTSTIWGTSRYGAVLNLDGSDDYVETSRLLTFPDPNRLSVVALVGAPVTRQTIVGHVNEANVFQVEISGSSGFFLLQAIISGVYIYQSTQNSIVSGALYDFAYTRDGGATNLGFLNGVELPTSTNVATAFVQATETTEIGRRSSGSQHFTEDIVRVLVYSRALSPNEIHHLYRDPLAPFRLRDRVISIPAAAATTTTVRVKRSFKPSYKSGFARSAAESANPGLWKELAGAWFPMLGTVGNTLPDVSGGGHPATWDAGTRVWGYQGISHAANTDTGYKLDMTWFGPPNQFSVVSHFRVLKRTPSGTDDANLGIAGWQGDADFLFRADEESYRNFRVIVYRATTNFDNTVIYDFDPNEYSVGFTYNADTGVGVQSINGVFTTTTEGSGAVATWTRDFHIYSSDGGAHEAFQDGFAYGRGVLLYRRVLRPSEILHLYRDPLAPFRLRDRVISIPGAAPAGNAPTSVLYGPLVGCLGGPL